MGPKYEFTGETKTWYGRTLHRIRRLSDCKIGGWIRSEDNLSQEGNCWVDDNAMVVGDAKVYGNAQVYDEAIVGRDAKVYDNAKVYGKAYVHGDTKVYGKACIYENAQVWGLVKVYGEAEVSEDAEVFGHAEVYGNACVGGEAKVYGNAVVHSSAHVSGNVKIFTGDITTDTYDDTENEESEVIKDFVYKIDDSSKLDVQSSYDSVDAFFEDNSDDAYVEHECLTIVAVDTKVPIMKLEKTQVKDQNVFKFIVDITNDDGDNYSVKSIIDSKDKFEQLLKSTIDSLKNYPQFIKYADDLENCV